MVCRDLVRAVYRNNVLVVWRLVGLLVVDNEH